MRSKPPATTFSSKALSFYAEGGENSNGQSAILVKDIVDRQNFATHDNHLTTQRDEGTAGQDSEINLRVTHSATLTNLMQSLKSTNARQAAPGMPLKQQNKYRLDLGQNVSIHQLWGNRYKSIDWPIPLTWPLRQPSRRHVLPSGIQWKSNGRYEWQGWHYETFLQS